MLHSIGMLSSGVHDSWTIFYCTEITICIREIANERRCQLNSIKVSGLFSNLWFSLRKTDTLKKCVCIDRAEHPQFMHKHLYNI